jgi:hypothetical protein
MHKECPDGFAEQQKEGSVLSNSKNIPVTRAELRRSTVRHSSAYFELFYTLKLSSSRETNFCGFRSSLRTSNVNACFLTGSTFFGDSCYKKYSFACSVTIDTRSVKAEEGPNSWTAAPQPHTNSPSLWHILRFRSTTFSTNRTTRR